VWGGFGVVDRVISVNPDVIFEMILEGFEVRATAAALQVVLKVLDITYLPIINTITRYRQ
jgi:hypothetical protein